MDDAQRLIAEVALSAIKKQAHVLVEDNGRVLIGGSLDLDHVAVEVDKALGGLKREQVGGQRLGDDPRLEPIYESRWVSGWTVTE